MANNKIVYLLVPGKGDKTYFNRAGAAFVNHDGSINVKLDMFPDLTFQLREPNEEHADKPKKDTPF